jgi:hypothetical protein
MSYRVLHLWRRRGHRASGCRRGAIRRGALDLGGQVRRVVYVQVPGGVVAARNERAPHPEALDAGAVDPATAHAEAALPHHLAEVAPLPLQGKGKSSRSRRGVLSENGLAEREGINAIHHCTAEAPPLNAPHTVPTLPSDCHALSPSQTHKVGGIGVVVLDLIIPSLDALGARVTAGRTHCQVLQCAQQGS